MSIGRGLIHFCQDARYKGGFTNYFSWQIICLGRGEFFFNRACNALLFLSYYLNWTQASWSSWTPCDWISGGSSLPPWTMWSSPRRSWRCGWSCMSPVCSSFRCPCQPGLLAAILCQPGLPGGHHPGYLLCWHGCCVQLMVEMFLKLSNLVALLLPS